MNDSQKLTVFAPGGPRLRPVLAKRGETEHSPPWRALLVVLNQLANALGVAFGVAVAHDGVGAAGRINADVRPDHPGADLHGRHLGDGDAFLRAAKEPGLDAQDALWPHGDAGGEEEITFRKPAGAESF